MWETYGLGREATRWPTRRSGASPFYRPAARRITLIHRAHQAELQRGNRQRVRRLPGNGGAPTRHWRSVSSTSQAHMYSSTEPLFIYQNGWFDTIPPGKKTWLTVRDKDLCSLRWGDPDFVRAYWTSCRISRRLRVSAWGRTATRGGGTRQRGSESARGLVIERQWDWFLLWGRLAYEPSIPNGRFEEILGRGSRVAGGTVSAAWSAASKTLPLMTRFYWGSLDSCGTRKRAGAATASSRSRT